MARSIGKSIPQPEWAKSVVRLRAGLVVNQVAFGNVVHCSAMGVSRWERGVSEPPSHIYIEMGNLSGDPLCWYFWGRAGFSKEDLLRVVPHLRERLRKAQMPHLDVVAAGGGAERPGAKTRLQLVAIPLLKSVAGRHCGKCGGVIGGGLGCASADRLSAPP